MFPWITSEALDAVFIKTIQLVEVRMTFLDYQLHIQEWDLSDNQAYK